MKNTGIRAIAQQLQTMGRDGDTILAHIMPHEAAMLKSMGGRGSVNPKTGLLEFAGADESGSSVTSSNYGGGGVSPGLSGFGGGSSSPGGVSSSGATNPSVGGGGGGGGSFYTSGGGRDSSSSNQSPSYTGGGGGGMLTAGTPTMVSSGGGSFTPMGGSSSNYLQSLGVPTIVANTMQSAANVAQSAGQGLLDFSDYTTGQYRQMMASPSQYFGSMLPSMPSAAQAGDIVGRGIVSLREALSAPEPAYTPAPSFRSEAAAGGYDFAPAAPATPSYVDPGGSGRMVSPAEVQMFNEMQRERFEDQYGTQASPIPAPQPVESIRLEQAPTYAGAPGFRSEAAAGGYNLTPVSLPGFRSEAALDALTAPTATPSLEGLPPGRFGTFDMQTAIQQYRQSLNNIQVPSGYGFNVTAGPYVNDPAQTSYYQTDEQIAQKILSNLPLSGLQLGPNGQIQTASGGMPSGEQMAQVASLASREFNVPQSKLPEGAVGQMTLDPRQFVDVRSVPMPPERPAEPAYAGPPGFRSEAAQNVAQSLDAEFEKLTKSASLVEGPPPAPVTRGITVPEQPAAVNLPTFAQVPLGSPMAFPETGAAAPTYSAQPAAPAGIVDYTTERLTDPRMQPANLRSAIENASLYYGMGYPSLVNMQVTPAGTAGMLANIQRESSFNPAAYNPKEFGFGFAQYQQKAALPAAGRLNSFLQGLNIDPATLPADKNARAAAIQSALANTDTEQIGYMLNEIATTKYYAPTYRAMTQEGVTPSQAATTYMRNFEGAKVVPSAQDIALGNEEAVRAQLNARIAAQAANAERIARTQFAGTQLSPTVSQSIQTSGLTSPQTTQVAIQNGELGAVLDQGWKEVIAAIGPADLPSDVAVNASNNVFDEAGPTFSGGGGRDTQPFYRTATREPKQLPVEETTPPVYTTGMDLTRRAYTPRLSTETLSPAYP